MGAFDDLIPQSEGAGAFDDLIPQQGKKKRRDLSDIAVDVGVTAAKGAVGLPQALVGLADIPTGGRVGKALEDAGYRPEDAQKFLDTQYSDATQDDKRYVGQADGFIDTVGRAIERPSTIATAVGESIPQMLGGASIARGGLALTSRLAPWVAGAIGEGVMGAGGAAAQIRGESKDGLLTPEQSMAAIGSGVGTAALGAAGGKLAQRLGVGDVDTMLAQGAGKLAKSPAGFVKQVFGAGISEGVFEELPQSAQEQMWQNYATGKPVTEGVGNAAAMGMLAGAAMGGAGGGYNATMGKSPVAPQDEPFAPPPTITPENGNAPVDQAPPGATITPQSGAADPIAKLAQFELLAEQRDLTPEERAQVVDLLTTLDQQEATGDTNQATPVQPGEQAADAGAAPVAQGPTDTGGGLATAGAAAATGQSEQAGALTPEQATPVINPITGESVGPNDPRYADVVAIKGSAAPEAAIAAVAAMQQPELDVTSRPPASWVIKEKATGNVILETFDKAKVDALNTDKYEAVPIGKHLASLNKRAPTDFWSFAKSKGFTPGQIQIGSQLHTELKAEYDALKAGNAAPVLPPMQPQQNVDLQNHDRGRAASVVQMSEIARNPDYMRLGPSRTPDSGAPMVFAVGDDLKDIAPDAFGREDVAVMSDGQRVPFRYAVVDATKVNPSNFADGRRNELFDSTVPGTLKTLNNKHTAGIRGAHELGTATDYVQAMQADTTLHGISPDIIARTPNAALVRVYSDSDNTAGMAAKSQGQGLGMSPAELARQDAPLMDSSVLGVYADGEVTSAGNRDFVRAFIGKLQGAGQDVAGMMTSDGQLSQDGRKRIQAALMQAAYGDSNIVEEMFDSTDTNIKAIGEALKAVAGRWANMRDSARLGAISPEVDITQNLLQAIGLIRKARRDSIGLFDLVNQPDLMTGETPDAMTVGMLRMFYSGKYLTRAIGKDKLAQYLGDYMTGAMATSADAGMFGDVVTPADILATIINRITQGQGNAETQPTESREQPAGGVTAGRGAGEGGQAVGRPGAGESRTGSDQDSASQPGKNAQAEVKQQAGAGNQKAEESNGAAERRAGSGQQTGADGQAASTSGRATEADGSAVKRAGPDSENRGSDGQVTEPGAEYSVRQQFPLFGSEQSDQLQLFIDSGPVPVQAGPGAVAAQRESVAALADLQSTSSILAAALTRDYAARQRISLVGQTVNSAEDLAVLAQVYRDPRFETFRAIFVDAGGKVVSQLGLTSRLPASASAMIGTDTYAYLNGLSDAARRSGATGYYLLHNHPSGQAKPSTADIRLTNTFDQHMPGLKLKSHVVIDTNEYATIEGGFANLTKKDFGQPAPLGATGVTFASPDEVVAYAKSLQAESGAVTLIATDAQFNVKAITTMPAAAINGEKGKLRLKVARALLRLQSSNVFAVGRESGALAKLSGIVVDAIHIEESGRATSLVGRGVMNSTNLGAFPQDRRTRVTADSSPEFAYLRFDPSALKSAGQRVAEGDLFSPAANAWQSDLFGTIQAKETAGGKISLLSRGAETGGMELNELDAIVSRIRAKNPNLPTVHVLEDPSTAPFELRKHINQQDAWYDVEGAMHDGALYLFASGLSDPVRAEHVLIEHEAAHYGLRAILGDKVTVAMNLVYANNGRVRKAAAELQKRGKLTDAEAAEEVIVDIPTSELAKLTGWRKVAAMASEWLGSRSYDRMAQQLTDWLDGSLTDQQRADLFVAELVRGARDYVAGKRSGDAKVPGTRLASVIDRQAKLWRDKNTADAGVALSRAEGARPSDQSVGLEDQTQTAAFKQWFGDSKVVDAAGKPLVVYHGTTADVESFDLSFSGSDGVGYSSPAIFATSDSALASDYALNKFDRVIADAFRALQKHKNENPSDYVSEAYEALYSNVKKSFAEVSEQGRRETGGGANVMPLYMSMQNPLVVDGEGKRFMQVMPDAIAKAVAGGHDGIIVNRVIDNASPASDYPAQIFIAFRPEQIKSAIGNNGNFDPANPDIRRSFAGQQAATADTMALATAQQRLEAGEDAEAVRRDTGWFRGADGKWRFEINDKKAKLLPKAMQQPGRLDRATEYLRSTYGVTYDIVSPKVTDEQMSASLRWADENKGGVLLDEAIQHDALFAAYPSLRNMRVSITSNPKFHGTYSKETNTITISQGRINEDGREDRVLSTLLHEIQHGIQHIEGFAMGGTPQGVAPILEKERFETMANKDDALTAEFDALKRQYAGVPESEIPQEVANRVRQLRREINAIRNTGWREASNPFARRQPTPEELFAGYRRLAGEVEARNTQARQNLTDAERRATPPSKTADVADSDVIVMFNGKEMANAPMPANAAPDAAATAQPLRTPAATIRAAITKAYGKLLGQLESKGLVTLTQTEEEAIAAAAQARADKTGGDVEQIKRSMLASVQMQRVWHGTPHRGIQQFSTDKIGTGEGAQAYGWGLYYASKQEIAEDYRKKLSGGADQSPRRFFMGQEFQPGTGGYFAARIVESSTLAKARKDVSEWIKDAETWSDRRKADKGEQETLRVWIDALAILKQADSKSDFTKKAAQGQLYEVEIPEDGDMLLWDKPLSEQSENVRKAIGGLPQYDNYYTGGKFYEALASEWDSKGGAEYVSRKMSDLGIKGIKYLDGTSRNAGDGSYNYVIFDGADTQIVDVKYSANGNIEGFFDRQTGKSFLVADNLTAASAPGTLMHEVGIHMSADGKLEPLFKRAGSLLKTGTQNEFIQRVNARMARAGETSDEEAAAYIVTEYENDRANAPASVQRWLADLLAAVKAWMFKKGIMGADRLTVADIAAVARANARSMARDGGATGGQGFGPAFSRAPAGDQTQTENFRRWFGDSKVVDADGKPLVVYRGRQRDYSVMQRNVENSNFSYGEQPDSGGLFFHPDLSEVDYYMQATHGYSRGANIMPVYLSLQNPAYLKSPFSIEEQARSLREAEARGHDGAFLSNGDIVVFRPEQIKSAIGNNGQFDPANPDIRLSRAQQRTPLAERIEDAKALMRAEAPKAPTVTQAVRDAAAKAAQAATNEAVRADVMQDVVFKLQDRLIDLKWLQGEILATGGTVNELNNAYLGEELYHGRAATAHEEFLSLELKPLLEQMHREGIGMEQLEAYLHARHAPEANAELAKRNLNEQQLQEMRDKLGEQVRDLELALQSAKAAGSHTSSIERSLSEARMERDQWRGAQAFDGTEEERMSLSGMSNEEAQAIIEAVPKGKRTAYEAMAKKVDAINAETRQASVRYGLVTRQQAEAWEKLYQHYVPLHRDEAHPQSRLRMGQGFSVKGKESQARTGSQERVTNILAHIAAQRELTITRGEKNRVAKKLWLLAAQNPVPGFWSLVPPKKSHVDNETGLVVRGADPTYKNKPNVLTVKIAGEEHAIVFDERNERAMRLVGELKNLDAPTLDGVARAAAKMTRWFAAVNTQYNPVFGVINFTRDVQAAGLQLSTTKLNGHQREVMQATLPALRAVWRAERGGKAANAQQEALMQQWKELQQAGGMTGYRDVFSQIEDRAKALDGMLAENDRGRVAKAAAAGLDLLTDYNQAMEGATRLAAYQQARKLGLSVNESASIAKNLTVNFNRKGALARSAAPWYAFFNAAMQGNARLIETLRGPMGKKIVAGGVLLGMATSLVSMALMGGDGGDDKDKQTPWQKIPDFVKERSMILGWGEHFIAVPMPLGYNIFTNAGRVLAEQLMGQGKPGHSAASAALDALTMAVGAFNPVGGSDVVSAVTPTPVDWAIDLLRNKDWTGKSIYRDDTNGLDPTPGHTRAKDSATPWAKALSRGVNWVTGGTEYTPGKLSPTPDQIDYVIGQLTGGVGREVGKLATTLASPFSADELPANKIPLISRVYGNTKSPQAGSELFYENVKKANELENEIAGRVKARESLDGIPQSAFEIVSSGNAFEAQVRALRKLRRQLVAEGGEGHKERVKEIESMMGAAMDEFNRRVNSARRLEARQ